MGAYEKTISRLYELQKFGIKLGLNSTEKMLERLDNPHLEVPCLHIAGTNGKGSVGAMVQAALLQAKVRVGMYISPHLVRFTERFCIAGREISQRRVIKLADAVWQVMDEREPPTFFEVVTAMAFVYFAEEGVDLAVMEVGMGGRLDATNVCQPLVTVITNIGLEHQEYLGKTLSAIAFEKAGIIKPGIPLIHGVRQPKARKVVEERARRLDAPIIRRGGDITFRRSQKGKFNLCGRFWRFKGLTTNLTGRYQAENACLALGALEQLARAEVPVEPSHFREGLMRVQWPGRLHKLPDKPGRPPVWLDGAHNLPAAKALVGSLDLVRQGRRPLVMVLGIMADKDLASILQVLTPAADQVIFSRPVYQRAATPESLAKAAPPGLRAEVIADLGRAIARAQELAGPEGVVLVTGSLFTVGEALALS
ncbi:MAG: folylpolyglutamate synthase/dihydrofolate synthase family protein [Desulfarculaceae bacterium]|jgi:dihydrofolate synthase/folylpolyglutamate synthase